MRIIFNKIALKGKMVVNKATSKHVSQNKKKKKERKGYINVFFEMAKVYQPNY